MNIKDYKEKQLIFFKKYWYILVLIGLSGITIGVIKEINRSKEFEEYAKIYPYYNTSTKISGIVIYIETGEVIKRKGEGLEFKLNDGKGYTLGWSENKSYSPYRISEFIQKGDSIYKASGTDSVLIYRNEKVYYFEISKRIDKNGNYY